MVLRNETVDKFTKRNADALTIQQIITFCLVYELGGYVGASEALGLAGPTVWEQVKTLERIYKTTLFERNGRNIRATSSGTALYKMLRPLLASVESTFERLAEESDEPLKQISLVTGVRMMLEELGTPLRKFQSLYPDAVLKLMTADNAASQQFVLEGQADVALLIEPSQSMLAHGLIYDRLYPIDYLAAFPSRHPLSRRSLIRISDLVEQPLIVGNANTIGRRMLEQACFRLGITTPLRIVAETDNSATTIACVRSGLGIGIIASRPNGNLTKHVTTRSLASEVGQVYVVAAYREGRLLTRALQNLLSLIQSAAVG